jgi:hypothetical protein
MTIVVPPRVQAFINEANVRAPGRRKTSDGTYVNKPGDHNVDERGINHAGDLGESMPGTPYWEPQFEEFDVHWWQGEIAAQYVAATPAVREQRWPWLFDGGYMHSYDYERKVDIIFHPAVSLTWRVDNNPPSEHIQHGHFSIGHTVRSENDKQPIFTASSSLPEDDMPLNKADLDAVRQIVKQEVEDAIGGVDVKSGKAFGRVPTIIKHYFVAAKLIK